MRQITISLSIVLIICFVAKTNAQDPRQQRRRALVEDLLRGLIESQVKPQPNNARPTKRPTTRPVTPRPAVKVEVSRDMLAARKHLTKWTNTSTQLVSELRVHEYDAPQLRPLMADAIKIQASVELLNRKAQLYPTIDPLQQEFAIVDQNWRVLSHRLQKVNGLPRKCNGYIDSIGSLDTQMCGLFNMQPQIDRRELGRLTSELKSDYDHMMHNVYYLARGRKGGEKLLQNGRNIQVMIEQSGALIQRGDYDTIVNAFQQSNKAWRPFSRSLSQFQDERLRYSVQKIETTGKMINEQLWLPEVIDREYLSSVSDSVAIEAQRVFDSITLSEILSHPQPGFAMNSAREFQVACTNFSRSLKKGVAVEDLEWDYRLFETQWDEMHYLMLDLKNPVVNRKLQDIETTMNALGSTFGQPPVIDHAMMRQLTANLDALSRQISQSIRQRVTPQRYDVGFQNEICGASDQFAQSVNGFHQVVLRQPGTIKKGKDLDDLFVQWRRLKPMITKCKSADRVAFSNLRGQIEPYMVKLQVIYAD